MKKWMKVFERFFYLIVFLFILIQLNFFKDLIDDLDDEDKSDIEFNDEDSESDDEKQTKNKKHKKGGDINSLFAAADDFASILDEEPDFMAGTTHAVSNKDKAREW